MSKKRIQELLEEERRLQLKVERQEGLPFLYGWPWYAWAKEFFESTNKMRLLVAANQISKSSTQIRLALDWATNQEKWPRLWRRKPSQFWYLYPTSGISTIEFEEKWKPEFLPQGRFKDDPVYGWNEEWKNKEIFAIHFKSGVSIYFKSYSQDVSHLQSGTVNAVFCDEELPENLYDELQFRLAATDGYFSMVFTATLGQNFWREAMEEIGNEGERFKGAFKKQISMYDCVTYDDGALSPWTRERISEVIAKCKSQSEILKRVFGRFVVDEGRKYPAFDREKNMKTSGPIPKDWRVFSGTDIGSGGEKGHPAAITFIAVDSLYRQGRIFRGWRGDNIETAASDILAKNLELRGNLQMTAQYYDQAAKDFHTYASRMGEAFQASEKSHEIGEDILNVLFKNGMLSIDQDEPELQKLAVELSTLKKNTPKNKAKDDFTDSLRYASTKIPWDFTIIKGELPEGYVVAKPDQPEYVTRREEVLAAMSQEEAGIREEFEELNEQYGN